MLHRLLPVVVRAIICVLALTVLTSVYFMSGLSVVSLAKDGEPPECDVPPGPSAMLDFCSPKNYGQVAGPYGAYITLASENLLPQPDHWVFVKDIAITDSKALSGCIQAKKCFVIPVAKPLNTTDHQRTFYKFSWSGQGIPTEKGNYYIEAIHNDPSTISNLQILAWTPVAYTLLTTDAPCIALSMNQKSSHCTSKSQNFPLQLGNNESAKLIITGENWVLGKLSEGEESLHITARCVPDQKCSTQDNLFDIRPKASADGKFSDDTVTIPATASGKYFIHATSHIDNHIQPDQSDYLPQPTNTVADNVLTFGGEEDEQKTFVLDIQRGIQASPTTTHTTGNNGNDSSMNETGLEFLGALAALPALLSMILFGILWRHRRSSNIVYQLPSVPKRAVKAFGLSAFSPFSQEERQYLPLDGHETILSPFDISFLLNRFLPIHAFLVQYAMRIRGKEQFSKPTSPVSNAKWYQALSLWEQKEKLSQAVNVTRTLLYGNIPYWRNFQGQLGRTMPLQNSSQDEQQAWMEGAVEWAEGQLLRALTANNKNQRLKHCSEVLVYYAILLSMQRTDIAQALIRCCMGFAYVLLAAYSDFPAEGLDLLKEANECYNTACRILQAYGNDYPDFLASLELAIGDVNTAMVQWRLNLSSSEVQEYRGMVQAAYQRAEMYESDPVVRDVVKKRQATLL